MAITPVYQAADLQTNTSANGTVVINKPTNMNTGDLMVAQVGASSISGSWTTVPSGWSTVANNLNMSSTAPSMGVFYKLASGSEPSTYTFVHSSNARSVGAISRVTNVDQVNPVDSFNSSVNNANSSTIAMGTVSPTLNYNLIMEFAGLGNTAPTAYSCTNVSSFTQQYTAAAPSTGGQISAATGVSTLGGSATASGTFASSAQSIGVVISITAQNTVSPFPVSIGSALFAIIAAGSSLLPMPLSSSFSLPAPTTTNSDSKWTRQQESTTAWSTGNKSASAWTDSIKTLAYNYLLAEDSTHLLQETGFKIILEQSGTPTTWTDQTKT